MHQAKEFGRGRAELFDEAIRERVHTRLKVEGDLRHALNNGELILHYQPIVSLSSGQIVGAEALVRWQHPERGLVLPGEFIPLAEDAGLIIELGDWVLGQACQAATGWVSAAGERLSVSVNVSGVQLGGPELPKAVERALQTSGLAPARLALEITETELVRDIDASIDTLLALKAFGIRVAIDDFGTGYSSLNYLRRLPIDLLKIDKVFIDKLGATSQDSAIVAAIAAMGRALNFRTVAEGVERPEQLASLRALACDLGQGYLFAKPLPNDLFIDVVGLGRHW
jgi:EAL domain-containing protein (putative c-di-GMP-specific phosphodiesterase class I)